MKQYKSPELEVVKFATESVIRTSGTGEGGGADELANHTPAKDIDVANNEMANLAMKKIVE